MNQKTSLRREMKFLRKEIPSFRRVQAASLLCDSLQNLKGNVLSYMPIGTEINVIPLNKKLAAAGRLYLPRVEENLLGCYQVQDMEDLVLSSLGIFEPNLDRCKKVMPSELDIVIAPGLAFDLNHHRLGYGKGFYDRILAIGPNLTIGVGFKEQLIRENMPTDEWDIPLNQVHLF